MPPTIRSLIFRFLVIAPESFASPLHEEHDES